MRVGSFLVQAMVGKLYLQDLKVGLESHEPVPRWVGKLVALSISLPIKGKVVGFFSIKKVK